MGINQLNLLKFFNIYETCRDVKIFNIESLFVKILPTLVQLYRGTL